MQFSPPSSIPGTHSRTRSRKRARFAGNLSIALIAVATGVAAMMSPATAVGSTGVQNGTDGTSQLAGTNDPQYNMGTTSAAAAAADAQVITVSSTATGTALSASSVGLSFEASDLALPGLTSGDLSTYLKTLGTSVIRIGGNTVDETFWTSSGETPPSWSIATIAPADLTALNSLAKASGWKVILGVNLKQYAPTRAADEAAHAVATLGSSLLAIEIGNEPNDYPQYQGNTTQYLSDFQDYVSAIEQAAPGAPIEGMDNGAAPDSGMENAFVAAQAAMTSPQITELTSHYYPLTSSTCGGSPTIAELLSASTHTDESTEAAQAVAEATQIHVPAVVDEGNSVVCEGQQGLSDVFAASLWAIDAELDMAQAGVDGYYMHGTVLQCDTAKPLFMYYTPLCAPSAADAAAGDLTAQPEYYGLATVHEVGTGDFLSVTDPDAANVRAYAVKHSDGSVTVVLDDVQDPANSHSTKVQLILPSAYAIATQTSLNAGGLSSTTGITLGGQSVQSAGTLAPPTTMTYTVNSTKLTVGVPAGSVQLITFSGSRQASALR